MVLNSDGTGRSYRDNADYAIEWSLDGENITITEKFMGMRQGYTGTLKDGKLDIFNGDETNALTNEMVYNKK